MDYRDYVVEMIEEGFIDRDLIIDALLKAMSQAAILRVLDENELSPRFFADQALLAKVLREMSVYNSNIKQNLK
jgi:hypothetical protein